MALQPLVERRLTAVERGQLVLGRERLGAAVRHALFERALCRKQLCKTLGYARGSVEQCDEFVPLLWIEHEPRAVCEDSLGLDDGRADDEIGEITDPTDVCVQTDL